MEGNIATQFWCNRSLAFSAVSKEDSVRQYFCLPKGRFGSKTRAPLSNFYTHINISQMRQLEETIFQAYISIREILSCYHLLLCLAVKHLTTLNMTSCGLLHSKAGTCGFFCSFFFSSGSRTNYVNCT